MKTLASRYKEKSAGGHQYGCLPVVKCLNYLYLALKTDFIDLLF